MVIRKKVHLTRTVITVKSGDKDNDRDEMVRRLKVKEDWLLHYFKKKNIISVETPDGMYDGENYRIEVKPLSGGMQEPHYELY